MSRRAVIAALAVVVGVGALALVLVLRSRSPDAAELAGAIYEDGHDGSAGDLWLGLVNEDVTREGARCMADALLGSDVPRHALRALVDHDRSVETGDLQDEISPALTGELGRCMTVTYPGVTAPSPGSARP